MKLSDYKGEAALDILADLIEPIGDIAGDKEVANLLREKKVAKAVKVAIKNHKRSVIEVLAVLDGEDPNNYTPSVFALPAKLLEILNDPEFLSLFTPQEQNMVQTSFGSATANTEANEQ